MIQTDPASDDWWMVDLEISLVKAFSWSLCDIDNTDIESLLPFIGRFAETSGKGKTNGRGPGKPGMTYCDRVTWL